MAIAASSSVSDFPFSFSPAFTQDSDLLRQLSFVPGLKELLMVRQVHALEHATIWLLSQPALPSEYAFPSTSGDYESLAGMSTDQGFFIYGSVHPNQLHQAVHVALRRLVDGEWNLAIHPRCGTNLSVGMLLAASLGISIPLILPKGPIEQLLGLGVAATAAVHLAPEVGSLAQRYITTAIPFNLAVENIHSSRDRLNRPVHFVKVRWIDQQ